MSAVSSEIIPQGYYKSNKKIYLEITNSQKLSNQMSVFNAKEFANWLKAGFDASPFKTQKQLVEAVRSNKATISRLMNASSQTLTNEPSQPDRELVIRLAETLKIDVDAGLLAAGYAPLQSNGEWAERVRIAFLDSDGWTEEEKERVLKAVELFVAGVRAERAANERDQGKE